MTTFLSLGQASQRLCSSLEPALDRDIMYQLADEIAAIGKGKGALNVVRNLAHIALCITIMAKVRWSWFSNRCRADFILLTH